MKLYKYIICGGLALTLTLSSCESWLEVEPNDTRTTDYFYTTPNEMEQALIGIYNGLLPIANYSWMLSEVRSDNAWVDKTTDKQRDYIDIGTFNPNISTISTLSSAWNDLYAENPENFVLGASRILTKEATTTGLAGNYSVNVKCTKPNIWYAKGYVVYTDKNGEDQTVYSDVVSYEVK